MDVVRRITLKAADLDAEPPTDEELETLRKKLESVRKHQNEAKPPDYSNVSKEKLIQILEDHEKEHRKIETFYRTQVDELEAELCDARQLILQLIDERYELDDELSTVRAQRQDLKKQLQALEIDQSRLNIEKDDLNHNLDLSQKQIRRLTQQNEEEQQKVDMLKSQTISLQESLTKEKQISAEALVQLSALREEFATTKKAFDELINENYQLQKKQEVVEDFTDESTKEAIKQLSLIILSKDKPYVMSPVTKMLVKEVFGEQCSKVIDIYESKLETLNGKIKSLRDEVTSTTSLSQIWLTDLYQLYDWIKQSNDFLEEGELDNLKSNFNDKMFEIEDKKIEIEEALKDSKSALSLAARRSLKDKEEAGVSSRPLFGPSQQNREIDRLQDKIKTQKNEMNELREKVQQAYLQEAQLRDQITELQSLNANLRKRGVGGPRESNLDIIRFLQCQAAGLEDILNGQIEEF
ncbi:unnamed protein product [Blepharisma stoltei]|uniref:Uncharacterized protein n=1 Tax=Blepharisma stoltei TaxID=1481888 RepID=A0AAU9JI28_9CILI|nr:unnamed protein product [Blepharisma stoltei]